MGILPLEYIVILGQFAFQIDQSKIKKLHMTLSCSGYGTPLQHMIQENNLFRKNNYIWI